MNIFLNVNLLAMKKKINFVEKEDQSQGYGY